MQQNGHTKLSGKIESLVRCKTSQGQVIRASAQRLTRHHVVFEITEPNLVVRLSEALDNFEIKLNEQTAYSGRAVVSSVINIGSGSVCEAALKDQWTQSSPILPGECRSWCGEFDQFLDQWQKNYRIAPQFKLAVADLQSMLADMRVWLDQAEFGLESQSTVERLDAERRIVNELQRPVLPALGTLFGKFEESCGGIAPEMEAAHRAYVQRLLHPIVLCAPFMNRTFNKPLGYAGDYEMVNMMVRDPQEGPSLFAKLLNTFFLNTPPVVAHRNRIEYLKIILTQEIARAARQSRMARIFNLGCGPAKEIQDFLEGSPLSDYAQFTLLDFNKETLQYTGGKLKELIAKNNRRTGLQMVERNIVQLLKESLRPNSGLFATHYDLVYCAGLFDYVHDAICEKLMEIFYKLLAPGGLLVVTNVDTANPSINWMNYSVDWHLIYRNNRDMAGLIPTEASREQCAIHSEPSGVNTFIEIRKPAHA